MSRKDEALDKLRELCKPGTTVYTILTHCSRSGMTRWINCYVFVDNEPYWLSGYIDSAGLFSCDRKRESLKVGGCGMDMGYHVVNTLSYALHGYEQRTDEYRPGYTLNHRWL